MFSASKSKGASGSYQVANSLRFRSSASAYLSRTPSTGGNQQTWTWSGWIKKGRLTVFEHLFGAASDVNNRFSFNFDNSVATGTNGDYLCAFIVLSGTVTNLFQTNALFRDPSSWYHVVLSVDTTQATSTNRLKLYVNGIQQTFSTYNAPAQNTNLLVNSAIAHNIASGAYSAGTYTFDGYMAEINFIDGQALDPSYFGKYNGTTGVWQPNIYTGTYGTNGFHLTFANNTSTTTLGYDSSPNGNNWTTNNISLTSGSTYDSMLDVPTNWTSGDPIQARGNYAVLNPLMAIVGNAPSNANLREASTGADTYTGARATFGISSGKWYWEQTIDTLNTSNAGFAQIGGGVCIATYALSSGNGSAGSWGFQNGNGAGTFSWKFDNGTGTNTYTLFGQGDIAGFALDMGAGTLDVYRNNTLLFTCSSSLSGNTVFPYVLVYQVSSSYTAISSINFGQRPFAYTPPTGFKALNTQNLPTPAIVNGAGYMAATTYTGTGSSLSVSNAVNSVSFQPDFVWIKSRSAATDHALYDVIRGTQNRLESNTTDAAVASDAGLTSFNNNGFTVNTLAQVNTNAATYVGWQWKANGTAVSNNAGSITSQVSANTTAGFSVTTFTCNAGGSGTFGHGLGVAPSMVIIKSRTNGAQSWVIGCSAIAWTNYLLLNQTGASAANSSVWNNTAPSSSVVTLGSGFTNANYGDCVAYCFAAIAGYSAFGSYTGNGTSDGPFVYLGFRPRFLLVKSAAGTSAGVANWLILDTSRSPSNVADYKLAPNLSEAENGASIGGAGSNSYDILSNGFKARTANGSSNENGSTFIYAAFAENPFSLSLAR